MKKSINNILILIILFVPMIAFPNVSDLFRAVFLIEMGIILLFNLIINFKKIKFDIKDLLIIMFLALAFISTIFSSNIKKSIVGESDRYEGLLMFITYTCIYFNSKKFFEHENVKKVLNFMFYVSMGTCILGVLQMHIDSESLYPLFNNGICSAFGNSNFFGSFISIILPISLSIFILYGNKKSFILTLFMFFNMISTGTRSAWGAFFVVGIIGLIYIIKQKNKVLFKRTLIIAVCFLLILVYLLYSPTSIVKYKMNLIKDDFESFKQEGLSNEMGSSRIEIWSMTLKLIRKNPLVGCGTDNLKNGLLQDCNKELHDYINKTGTIVDKAHNEYLHIAATIGIPACVIYLIFILLILLKRVKLIKEDNTSFITFLVITSYLVQAFFNISVISVAPLFWFILGVCDNKDIIDKNIVHCGKEEI